MEDQSPESNNPSPNNPERSEPVRSRWSPKPEQILILESIFNSGMVNPPKDETVRIRKMLEQFGSVGDANVFYWFQNRRSRSRRRQRQIQAGLISNNDQRPSNHHNQISVGVGGGAIQYDHNASVACFATSPCIVGSSSLSSSSCGVSLGVGMGVGNDDVVDNLFSFSHRMGLSDIDQNSTLNPILCPSDNPNLHYQSGLVTVFINGVPTEVPTGPIDMKAVFGQDVILVHSSGIPVPTNELGISLQSLQLGESYFLVSGPT